LRLFPRDDLSFSFAYPLGPVFDAAAARGERAAIFAEEG
jgi:hypothetical protein